MKIHFITFILSLVAVFSFGQSVEIKPGSVLPVMTTAQRTSLVSPLNGTLVFDSNTQSYWFRQSGLWTELPKGGSTNNHWELNGNAIKNTNSGGFWSSNPTVLPFDANSSSHPNTAPTSGSGTRLMWIPSRSAFRVGTVSGLNWDADSIAIFSFASGYNTNARGRFSTAMGFNSSANSSNSIAIGSNATTGNQYSVAIGYYTNSKGFSSTALGSNTTSEGWASTAMGNHTTATGNYSTSMGFFAIAQGDFSTAIGHRVRAQGRGSFIIGDYVGVSGEQERVQTTENRFTARFRGGYFLMTSGNSGTITGVQMAPGANSWGTVSDSTKKEKFVSSNSDMVLQSIAQIRVGTWNYKGQDPTTHRHWGVMAQDFHKHFGKDTYGTIGSDTTISTADFDGVAFAAIKGLEERTRVLSEKLTVNSEELSEQLKTNSEKLEGENAKLKDELEVLRLELSKLKEKEDERNKQWVALLKEFAIIKNQNSLVLE